MRTLGVVAVHPVIELGLGPPERREGPTGEDSLRRLWWNRSTLPVVVGERTAVWRWEMPFSR